MARTQRRSTTRRRDVIALLREDHKSVKQMLKQLSESTARAAKKRERLLREITEELRAHTQVEEALVYPAFREAARTQEDRKLFFEAKEEHRVVDGVLSELAGTDPGTGEFAARAKVLRDLVEHHIQEEERELLPRLRKLCEREELVELGRRVERRKAQLLRGGSAMMREIEEARPGM